MPPLLCIFQGTTGLRTLRYLVSGLSAPTILFALSGILTVLGAGSLAFWVIFPGLSAVRRTLDGMLLQWTSFGKEALSG